MHYRRARRRMNKIRTIEFHFSLYSALFIKVGKYTEEEWEELIAIN